MSAFQTVFARHNVFTPKFCPPRRLGPNSCLSKKRLGTAALVVMKHALVRSITIWIMSKIYLCYIFLYSDKRTMVCGEMEDDEVFFEQIFFEKFSSNKFFKRLCFRKHSYHLQAHCYLFRWITLSDQAARRSRIFYLKKILLKNVWSLSMGRRHSFVFTVCE